MDHTWQPIAKGDKSETSKKIPQMLFPDLSLN
jgi:hypothetical protein